MVIDTPWWHKGLAVAVGVMALLLPQEASGQVRLAVPAYDGRAEVDAAEALAAAEFDHWHHLAELGEHPDDHRWSNEFYVRGLDGTANAMVVADNGDLYVGGGFVAAGGKPIRHLARWDGQSWHSLPGELPGPVQALAIDENGVLHAAGSYFHPDGTKGYVMRLDGESWTLLGEYANGSVMALALEAGGIVHAGGSFASIGGTPTARVARWDGESWRPLGAGFDSSVRALAVDGAGTLFAGGYFRRSGSRELSWLAQWDGDQWTEVGGGVWGSGFENGVEVITTAPDGSIYVGGGFRRVAGDWNTGIFSPAIARWDGTKWNALGPYFLYRVRAIAVAPDGTVYAGGDDHSYDTRSIARWDGEAWHFLGDGVDDQTYALAVGLDGHLYAGGWFAAAGDVGAQAVARWDGAHWHAMDDRPPGGGLSGEVVALARDADGQLYAGGRFRIAGSARADNIARWDGREWSSLDGGTDFSVSALAIDDSGNLYAGGGFTTIGGISANRVARWDGHQWHPMGDGMSTGASIRVLLYGPDGRLYAGGSFESAGGVAARGVAAWDGQQWQPIGELGQSLVSGLAFADDGSLYAGGILRMGDDREIFRLARWDGQTWLPLDHGSIALSGIDDLTFDAMGRLVVGGTFGVVRQSEQGWEPLGEGMNHWVLALARQDNGDMYASGSFSHAGDVVLNRIGRWDGASWNQLGSGVGGWLAWDVLVAGDEVWVAGNFRTAGGRHSSRIARWDGRGAEVPPPPESGLLAAPFPNPVSGIATLAFDLPRGTRVTIAIYDVLGRRVAVVLDDLREAGGHTLEWDVTGLVAGTYFVRLTSGERSEARALTVVR